MKDNLQEGKSVETVRATHKKMLLQVERGGKFVRFESDPVPLNENIKARDVFRFLAKAGIRIVTTTSYLVPSTTKPGEWCIQQDVATKENKFLAAL